MSLARDVIARLQKENPAVLADQTALPVIDLSKVDDMTPPSEMKRLSDALRKKRLTAPGLSDEELGSLMRRIGKNGK
jgi:hypothetical protein